MAAKFEISCSFFGLFERSRSQFNIKTKNMWYMDETSIALGILHKT